MQYPLSPQDFQLRRRRTPRAWRNPATLWSLLFAAVLGGAVFASAPEHAGSASSRSGATQVVQQVVQQQLKALATQDAMQAFALADQDLRTQFGSADAFLTTVREQYPMLMHPTSVLFLRPQTDGTIAMQKVRLTDDAGASWSLTYLLNRQKDDQWRISGCVVTSEGRQVLT